MSWETEDCESYPSNVVKFRLKAGQTAAIQWEYPNSEIHEQWKTEEEEKFPGIESARQFARNFQLIRPTHTWEENVQRLIELIEDRDRKIAFAARKDECR